MIANPEKSFIYAFFKQQKIEIIDKCDEFPHDVDVVVSP